MAASSVTGVGQGSADKKGQKGSEHLYVGVEKLIGPRVIRAGTVTLSGATTTVTFPQALSGVAADYIVIADAAHNAWATSLTISSFVMNGTSADVVSYIVVRVTGATVEVN